MPDHDSNIPPGEAGVTGPMQPTPPAPSSRPAPTSSHYSPELPLPEELQAMLGGSYVVESFLGQGGMGAVYKGLQMPLRRPVAIKILAKREAAGGDEDEFAFEERFKREAYAMAALTHPNIVQVYDCGDAGEHYLYISMELVEGGDLSDAIKGGQCTPDVALKLIPQICDGLQAAHERGLVHRDIKPANIFLTKDGRPKVADFGLAKKFDAQSTFATKTGMAMGTPDYAAPEQYEAVKDIDHRADVYSLGVMMYQMLTGTLPRGAYRPPSQRAAVDARLDAVVFKAMEHERSDRYQSVAEIKAELAAIAASTAKPQSTVKRSTATPAVATAAPSATRAVAQPQSAAARGTVTRAVPASTRAVPAAPKKGGGAGMVAAVLGVVALLAVGAWFMMKPKPAATASATGPPSSPGAGAPKFSSKKPAPAVAAGAPNSPASNEQWVDVLREYFALPVEKRNVKVTLFEPSPEGWKVNKRGAFNLSHFTPGGRRNVALRSTVRGIKDSLILALRTTGDDVQKNMRSYWAQLKPDGSVAIVRRDQTQPTIMTELSHSAPVPGFAPEARHTFEFRAVEDVLTATLDGRALDPVRDTVCTNGGLSFTGNAGMIVEKLELADLSAQPPAAGSSTASAKDDPSVPAIAGWKDMMAAAKKAIPKVGQTGVREEDGWLVATGYRGMASAGLDAKVYRDVALRGRVRGSIYVNFRSNAKLPGYYSARFLRNGTGNITLIKSGSDYREEVLSKFRMSASPEHSFLVAATGPDIRLWVDGQLLATAHDTTIADGLVGIAMAEEGAAFRDLEVAELPAEFFSKTAAAPASGEEKWIDGLAEWWASSKVSGTGWLVREGGGARVTAKYGITLGGDPPVKLARDVAVRVVIRNVSNYCGMALRDMDKGTPGGRRYSSALHSNGSTDLGGTGPGGVKLAQKSFRAPPGFVASEPITYEFRVQGDLLKVFVNGRETGSMRDSELREPGRIWFYADPGTLIEKLEYCVLDGAAGDAAAAGR